MTLSDLVEIIYYQALVNTFNELVKLENHFTFDDLSTNLCRDEDSIKVEILNEIKNFYDYQPTSDWDALYYNNIQNIIEKYNSFLELDKSQIIGEHDCYQESSYLKCSEICKSSINKLFNFNIKRQIIKRTTKIYEDSGRLRIENIAFECNKYVYLSDGSSEIKQFLTTKNIQFIVVQNSNFANFLKLVYYHIDAEDFNLINRLDFDWNISTLKVDLKNTIIKIIMIINNLKNRDIAHELQYFAYLTIESILLKHKSDPSVPSVNQFSELWKNDKIQLETSTDEYQTPIFIDNQIKAEVLEVLGPHIPDQVNNLKKLLDGDRNIKIKWDKNFIILLAFFKLLIDKTNFAKPKYLSEWIDNGFIFSKMKNQTENRISSYISNKRSWPSQATFKEYNFDIDYIKNNSIYRTL